MDKLVMCPPLGIPHVCVFAEVGTKAVKVVRWRSVNVLCLVIRNQASELSDWNTRRWCSEKLINASDCVFGEASQETATEMFATNWLVSKRRVKLCLVCFFDWTKCSKNCFLNLEVYFTDYIASHRPQSMKFTSVWTRAFPKGVACHFSRELTPRVVLSVWSLTPLVFPMHLTAWQKSAEVLSRSHSAWNASCLRRPDFAFSPLPTNPSGEELEQKELSCQFPRHWRKNVAVNLVSLTDGRW